MKKLSLLILLFFDYFHKKKIINFIKRKIDKVDSIIDVGAHHGESIKLFLKNFKILNIYAFEPSSESFKNLKINKNYLFKKKKINFKTYNLGLGSSLRCLAILSIDSFDMSGLYVQRASCATHSLF